MIKRETKLFYVSLFFEASSLIPEHLRFGSVFESHLKEASFPLENHRSSRFSMFLFLPEKLFGPGDHGSNFQCYTH